MANSRICEIPNCGKTHLAHGLCRSHYMRKIRHGDPLAGRTADGVPIEHLRAVLSDRSSKGCVIWPYGRDSDGYGQIWKDGRVQRVHRIVCEEANGAPATPELQAAHSCGNGHEGCCNPAHLRWATPAENQADRLVHGTSYRGRRNGPSKLPRTRAVLDESSVRVIRQKLADGNSCRSLANVYGVSSMTISKIGRRVLWAHV